MSELSEELRFTIRAMQAQDGLYLLNSGGGKAPLVVIAGKIYSMKIDCELAPDRFLPGAEISGPLHPIKTK